MSTSFDIHELNNAVLDAAKTIKDMRKKLFNLKEFGPGNYNIFIAILMYLF